MFEQLYKSPWTATALLATVNLVGLVAWLRRKSFLVGWVVLCAVVAFGDALRSGAWSPLHLLASPHEDNIGLLFVLFGDFRFFLLVERFACRPKIGAFERTAPKAWLTAIGLTVIAPLLSLALMQVYPTRFTGRWTYLFWELLLVGLVTVYRSASLPKRLATAPDAVRKWLFQISLFETVQYALWASADIIIFLGADAGFLLRVVPNVLYYGVFLWFAALRAPAEVRE